MKGQLNPCFGPPFAHPRNCGELLRVGEETKSKTRKSDSGTHPETLISGGIGAESVPDPPVIMSKISNFHLNQENPPNPWFRLVLLPYRRCSGSGGFSEGYRRFWVQKRIKTRPEHPEQQKTMGNHRGWPRNAQQPQRSRAELDSTPKSSKSEEMPHFDLEHGYQPGRVL